MKVSIIVPVYNSESSLQLLYDQLKLNMRCSYEVIFVNDCSSDNSGLILDALGDCKVIHLPYNHGQQHAIFIGMHHAMGDYIVTIDDDLQHDTKDIMTLVEEIEKGYELVYAISRDDYQVYRQLGSKLTGHFFKSRFKHMAGKRVSSFRIFTKALNEQAMKCPYRFIYLSGILLNLTKNIGQISVIKHQRPYGQSGYNIKKLLLLFIRLNYYYGRLPDIFKVKRKDYEKTNDTRRRQLPIKRHS